MLVPLEWLKEYAEVPCGAEELARRLTFSGTKAEGIRDLGVDIENVVTGRLLTVEKHPNADKLLFSQVDVGEDSTVQIVTGAKNIKAGDIVPIALSNSRLPNGLKIKATKMRGLESQGMMCSIQELNLSKNDYPDASEDGIFILPTDTKVGMDMKVFLGLDDQVIDFEITTNRPDCLSMLGIARETAATLDTVFTQPHAEIDMMCAGDVMNTVGNIDEMLSVEVLDDTLCKRYTARAVKNAVIRSSPEWMKRRLRNAGVRPINNIVDITNYVMLETGQPLHAFDARFISGGKIIVRRAGDGESIRTLDGNDRLLSSAMLVIADREKPIAVAGVMGGENSEILDDTRTIIFESASFEGVSVRKTARSLNMRTESSSRYEKGLDPDMTKNAADRAVQLVRILEAGDVVGGVIDVYPNPKERARVHFSPTNINALLGTAISRDQMLRILKKLEFTYDEAKSEIIAPTYRADVSMEADLAEEVARFYDYNNITATLNPGTKTTVGIRSLSQRLNLYVADTVLSNGFSEIYTFSFQGPKSFDKLRLPENSPLRNAVRLANPTSEDASFMRTTTLPDMFKVMADNAHQRIPSGEFYEIASVYLPNPNAKPYDEASKAIDIDIDRAACLLPLQRPVLTLGAFGGGNDIYSIKACFEDIVEKLGIKRCEIRQCDDIPYYHTGRSAKILIKGVEVGSFGEIHPSVAEMFSLPERAYAGTLSLDAVYDFANLSREYKKLPKFPPVPRDLAFLADGGLQAGTMMKIIRKAGGSLLEDVSVFDVYTGKQVPEGKKSIAFSLVFRSEERTLKDDEVATLTARIVTALENETGAIIRR